MKSKNFYLLLLTLCSTFSLPSKAQTPKKQEPVKQYAPFLLTREQGAMLYQAIETSKKAITVSEVISAKEASQTFMALDSIQKVIYRQYADSTRSKIK